MDNVVLLSYPRSGNSWMRYIFKHMIGDVNLVSRHGFIYSEYEKELYFKLILIIRNYKECLPRHLIYRNKASLIKKGELFGLDILINKSTTLPPYFGSIESYMHNIKVYDNWNSDKILISYEELITDPKKTLKRIHNFFKEKREDGFVKFMTNYQKHKETSVNEYGDRSWTKGNAPICHSRNCSSQERVKIDDYIKSINNDLYQKYLSQYREKAE